MTNAVEYLVVNKQIDPNFKVKAVLKEKGILKKLLLKGSLFRTSYYGVQATVLFCLMDLLGIHLDINITEFDE